MKSTWVPSFLLAPAAVFFIGSCSPPESVDAQAASRYLELADQVATWLEAQAIHGEGTVHWKPWVEAPGDGDLSLYAGTPGVVLFFLEHHALTGSETSRELAEGGIAWMVANNRLVGEGCGPLPKPGEGPDPGLYTGAAGVGAVYLAARRVLDDDRFDEEANRVVWSLLHTIRELEQGTVWSDSTDIISGTAGVGLFLLRAGERPDSGACTDIAAAAGDALIDAAVREESGWKWRINDRASRIYPNFSHGTSGVAYFLAALYRATGEERYLEAALAGAEWLAANEESPGEGTAWFHHEPDGKDLYYVSWCHGPGGTARLFRELHSATGDEEWLDRERECAEWLTGCGLFEQPLDGFWNVSACCGSAGIGDFFADLYRFTGEPRYLEWAERMVDDLVERATPGEPGLKWIQAEHRVRPDWVFAQTGLAQGAAGIGLFFLKMHAIEVAGRFASCLALPDSPYGTVAD